MTTHFELQPTESELQELAEQCWQEACNKERQLEKEAFDAGADIRGGDYSLTNLEAIVRWKSEPLVQYLIRNSSDSIRRALEVAAAPESSTGEAVTALLELHLLPAHSVASTWLPCVQINRFSCSRQSCGDPASTDSQF